VSKSKPAKLDPLMEGYLEYQEHVERRAAGTLKDVRCTLRRVTAAMEQLRPGKSLWELKLTDFIAWLEQQRQAGYSTRGLCKNVSHLRGFLNYAWRSGRCDRNVMSDFYPEDRCQPKEPESLTIEEALGLVQACPCSTPTERRDRVIILLLYGCGLRTGELCSLRVEDIDTERRELHVKGAKGDIERMIPIPDIVFIEVLAHLLERGVKRGPLLVTAAKRRRVRQRLVVRVVREAAERAGIEKKVTPKTLRHSFATHLMDRGVDAGQISKLMGHAGPAESGVYLHILPGRKRSAVDKLDLD
jgi:integrase/recombinase XerD